MHDKKPIRKFEELVTWQKARSLVRSVYAVTSQEPFNTEPGFRNQIRRASVSTMSNIAEGCERGSQTEFHQLLGLATGSCAELRSHLCVAVDAGLFDQRRFAELRAEAERVSRIVSGLRASVQRQHNQSRSQINSTTLGSASRNLAQGARHSRPLPSAQSSASNAP